MASDKVIQLTWLLLTYHIAMAGTENDPKVEVDDGEALGTPGYKPPANKTLEEIQNADADDEGLRYKQHLLDILPPASDHSEPGNVLVEKMIFQFERRAVELDLTDGTKLDKRKYTPITIKEGCEYILKFSFKVRREGVEGLRLLQKTFKKGIRIHKSYIMLGSYAPQIESHVFITSTEGGLKCRDSRGFYTVKSMLTGDGQNVYFEWEWSFHIKKDWD